MNPGKRALYARKIKDLREFARGFDAADGFNLCAVDTLRGGKLVKLNKYWQELQRLTDRPFEVSREFRRERLKKVQSAAQHPPGYDQFKVAFIPTDGSKRKVKVRIEDKTGRVIFQQGKVKRVLIPFSQSALAANSKREVKRATDQVPNAKRFRIQAGDYEVGAITADRGAIWGRVNALMEAYSGEKYETDDGRAGHGHYSKWLFGLVALDSPELKNVRQYIKQFHENKKVLQKANRKDADKRRAVGKQLNRKKRRK